MLWGLLGKETMRMRTRWSLVRKNSKNGIATLSDHNDNAPANTIWETPDFQLEEEIEAGHLVKKQPLTKCDGSQKLFRLLKQNVSLVLTILLVAAFTRGRLSRHYPKPLQEKGVLRLGNHDVSQ